MMRGSTTSRLLRSDRCITIGSFSIGTLDLAVALSVLIHAGILGVVVCDWLGPIEQRARTDFASGEQSVTVTNLRFISAEELEAMEQPQRLRQTPEVERPAPPQVPMLTVTARQTTVSQEVIAVPEKDLRALPPGSRVPPVRSQPRAAPSAPSPPPSTQRQLLGVTRGVSVADLPTPKYPVISRRLGEQGLVLLAVSVDSAGRVTDVRVLSDPGYPRLVRAATEAVRAARFTPAMREGRAVADVVRVPFRFRLESR